MQSGSIKINRGIFQGDSLSPLFFCIALIPLTLELINPEDEYQVRVCGAETKMPFAIYG